MTTQARELAKLVSNAGDLNFIDDIALGSDGAVLNFGADSDVSLTHVHNTGLLVNSTRQLQFGDSGTYIHQSADGVLDLVSDTEIELNATTLDINANVDISGTLTVAGTLDFGEAALNNVGAVQLDSIAGDSDTNTSITFSGSDTITVAAAGANQVTFKDGAFSPVTDSDIDLGTSSLYFKDTFFDTVTTTGAVTVGGTLGVTGVLTTTAATVFNGGFASNAVSTITDGTSFSTGLTIANTGDTHGSVIDFFNNSDSPADNDYIGGLIFKETNSAGGTHSFGKIFGMALDITDGTEDGAITFETSAGGANTAEIMSITNPGVGIGTRTIANESEHKKLKISGASGTGAGMIEFADGSNNIDAAIFSDDGNLFIVADRDNATGSSTIRFRVDGSSEKMRIDSSGRLLLGTTTEGETSADNLTIEDTGSAGCGITIRSGTAQEGKIFFSDGTSGAAEYQGYMIYNHSNSSLALGTAGSERARILGNNLHLNGGTDARIQLGSGGAGANSTSNDTVHIRGDGDDMKLMAAADGKYIFEVNGSEKVRIDSSGNMMVGTTQNEANTDANDTGSSAAFFGMAVNTSSNHSVNISSRRAPPLLLNRMANDGLVVSIRAAGSQTGVLATVGGDLVVGSHNTCLRFDDSADDILPTDDAGVSVDNTLVLGASNARFKEIFLSNGVNFSANSNASGMSSEILDDYEEGTWTSVITTSDQDFSFSGSQSSACRYTKIGRHVWITFESAIPSPSNGTGAIRISGLPFANTGGSTWTTNISWGRTNNAATQDPNGNLPNGSDVLTFYYNRDANVVQTFSAANMNGQVTPFLTGALHYEV